jgi:hypothetical protein
MEFNDVDMFAVADGWSGLRRDAADAVNHMVTILAGASRLIGQLCRNSSAFRADWARFPREIPHGGRDLSRQGENNPPGRSRP